MPDSSSATISSAVATGRRMKRRERFMSAAAARRPDLAGALGPDRPGRRDLAALPRAALPPPALAARVGTRRRRQRALPAGRRPAAPPGPAGAAPPTGRRTRRCAALWHDLDPRALGQLVDALEHDLRLRREAGGHGHRSPSVGPSVTRWIVTCCPA